MLKLYDYFRSSAAYRVRIALRLKKLDYQQIPVHLIKGGGEQFKAEYRALNPQARVPSLDIDGLLLTQSMAIIEYLDETHPEPAFLPADAARDLALEQVDRLAHHVEHHRLAVAREILGDTTEHDRRDRIAGRIVHRHGQRIPAATAPKRIGLAPTGRRHDVSIRKTRADTIANLIERRQSRFGKFGRFRHRVLKHAVTEIGE